MNDYIRQFKAILHEYSTFVLTTHVNPDGDAIGSEVALASFLSNHGKKVSILNPDKTPYNLQFLHEIFPVSAYDKSRDHNTIVEADCIIVVDTNSVTRFLPLKESFTESRATKVIIDHHLNPEPFARYTISTPDVPATSELLYLLIVGSELGSLTLPIATGLYTGIMTDSGSFRFPLTSSETHRITAALLETGVQPDVIYGHVYESGAVNKLQLLGKALSGITLHHSGKTAVMMIEKKTLQETDSSIADVDNFTQYIIGIKDVIIGMIIVEMDNQIKISLRSKGDMPVNEIARIYGGGGHKNAAGIRIPNAALEEAKDRLLNTITSFLNSRT